MVIDWKEAARHFWHGCALARQSEIIQKQRLWNERQKLVSLANTLSDILGSIAYSDDDPGETYCNVCCRHLIEEGGHRKNCLYIQGLTEIIEASRSQE